MVEALAAAGTAHTARVATMVEMRWCRNMPPPCGSGARSGRGGSPGVPLAFGECPRQLGPRAHAELGVDAREVVLDRLGRQEERARDLLVRAAACDELGDVVLALGQLALDR